MSLNGSGPNGSKPIQLNVLGNPIEECSIDPVTGFFRNGDCSTSPDDIGSHTVCAQVTREFLEFSKQSGNPLVLMREDRLLDDVGEGFTFSKRHFLFLVPRS